MKLIKKLFNLRTAFAIILLQYLVTSFAIYPVFAATTTYSYDANGNMTSDGTNCYTYNDANQLSQVKNCSNNQTIAQYVYDGNGNRIIKKNYVNGVLNNTVYSPEDEYETKKLANNTTQNTTYYFANGQQVAKKNPDGTKEYIQNDQLGSASVITDQAGNLVEQTNYDPWGNVLAGGTQTKFDYTGQEKDSETGLDYYNARYYDPAIRRFTQPDNVLPNVYDPQQLNRYAYVRNNPIKNTDPSGHFLSEIIQMILESPVGALISRIPILSGILNFIANPAAEEEIQSTVTNPNTQNVVQKTVQTVTQNAPAEQKAVQTATNLSQAVNKISLWPASGNGPQVINGIRYTTHALESMAPSGLIQKGTEIISNGVPPSVVENAIQYGEVLPGSQPGTIQHIYENVTVVTDLFSSRVITVWKTGH